MSRLGLFPPPSFPSSRPRLLTDVVLLVNGPPCFPPPLEGDCDYLLVCYCCVGEFSFVLLVSLFTSGGGPNLKILLTIWVLSPLSSVKRYRIKCTNSENLKTTIMVEFFCVHISVPETIL